MSPTQSFCGRSFRRSSSGSLAIFAAIRRASSRGASWLPSILGIDGLCSNYHPNHDRNHDGGRVLRPNSLFAALSLARCRSSAAVRANSAFASLRSASDFASRAAVASAFACSASLVARPASSCARFKARCVNASEALAFRASAFTRWSSFSVKSASVVRLRRLGREVVGSEVGREVVGSEVGREVVGSQKLAAKLYWRMLAAPSAARAKVELGSWPRAPLRKRQPQRKRGGPLRKAVRLCGDGVMQPGCRP